MQYISAEPLVQKFKNGTFQQSEIGPYFMANMILSAAFWIFSYRQATVWDILGALASVIITFFGLLHLKEQNLDTFGNDFASKYFCLGWVIFVRTLLFSILAGVVIVVLTSIVGLGEARKPIMTLVAIGCQIIYYWWLGSLFAQSNQTQT
jgi:hypothetical protein